MKWQSGWIALLVWAACAGSAMAQTPQDIVRWIYTSLSGGSGGLDYLTDPERRKTYLSRRLVQLYEIDDVNSEYGDNLMTACFERGFEIPGNDFDAAEIARTLSLAVEGDAAHQRITARFITFGKAAQVHYDFIIEDGYWRIDDIGLPGWSLSDVTCTPRTAATPAPAGETRYCYRTGSDELRLYVKSDGTAWFSVESWQGSGHFCGAEGDAQPITGGWLYQEDFYGRLCRMEIRVTPDGGIRLSDPNYDCKSALCGNRAILDGLSFTRARQVDCATLPALRQN